MKPWQLAVGVGAGALAFFAAFKVVRAATGSSSAKDGPSPAPSPTPTPSPKPAPTQTKEPAAKPSTSGSPLPDNALPTFLSAPNGDYAYYLPVQPPVGREVDLWRPLTTTPSVGDVWAAVVSFTAKTGSDVSTTTAPVPVTVKAVDPTTGAVKVSSAAMLKASATEPRIAETPLPEETPWTLPSAAMLGAPSPEWFAQFTYEKAADHV